jgi:hypothetical protein
MARIIEEVSVRIGADTRKLNQGMKKAKRDVGALTSAFKKLGGTIIAAFGARAVFRAFQQTLNSTNALIKTAKGVGFLVTEYQQLTFALDQVGVGAQSARIALGDFQKRLGKAVAGTSPQFAKAFRDAGLDPTTLSKLSPAAAFDAALKQLATMRNDPRIAGLTGAVFEEQSGKDILQLLRQWERYLGAREKFARRVGGFTKEQQDNIERLADELKIYRAQWEMTKAKIVADAAPDIIRALGELQDAGVFDEFGKGISRFFKDVSDGIATTRKEIELLKGALEKVQDFRNRGNAFLNKGGARASEFGLLGSGVVPRQPSPAFNEFLPPSMQKSMADESGKEINITNNFNGITDQNLPGKVRKVVDEVVRAP